MVLNVHMSNLLQFLRQGVEFEIRIFIAQTDTHVADGLPQPLRNARKLGVNFFETLLPGEHEMGLKKKFHRRKIF